MALKEKAPFKKAFLNPLTLYLPAPIQAPISSTN